MGRHTSRVALAATLLCVPWLVNAAVPGPRAQAPGFYRMAVGAFTLTALSDGTDMLPAKQLLSGASEKEIADLLSHAFLQEPVETSINAFLIDTGTKLVLIDSGAGTLMGPALGKLLANLRAAGYQPEQINEIYITHMHPDHIGGLTTGGKRAFVNALVRADKSESDFWLDPAKLATAPADAKPRFQQAQDMLAPYVAAGKFSPFTAGAALTPGIRSQGSHGHTPGHSGYLVESGTTKLLVWGDVVHVGSVQFAKPPVGLMFDADGKAAAEQRALAFRNAAAAGYWIAGAHLSFPGLGHVRAGNGAYEWVPANYSVTR